MEMPDVRDARKIRFDYADVKVSIPQRLRTKSLISKIFLDHRAKFRSLLYILCSDAYLLDLNREFLSHDTLTDIITFRLSPKEEDIEGELYISVERVAENAIKFNSPFALELRRVMFHGALHLCGFGDKTKTEKAQMRSLEDYYLSLF